MRLLVGIHLAEIWHRYADFAEFVRRNFRRSKNTSFVLFEWPIFSQKDLANLIDKLGLPKERFFVVPCSSREKSWSAEFESYKEGFERVLGTISTRLGKKEKIVPVFFGGDAKNCFEIISSPALIALEKKFGNRVVGARTNLNWVYGTPAKLRRPLSIELPKRAVAKKKLLFRLKPK